MREKQPISHYQDLLTVSVDRDKKHKDGVAVLVLPSLIKRTDGTGVFEEGEAFSGIERQGNAEACLTITASPHVTPTISKDIMTSRAEQILKRSISLPPGMQEVDKLSPQLILWWQRTNSNDEGTDMLRISQLREEEQSNFCEVMAKQTERAALIINGIRGKSIVWGSWGNGTFDERAQQGKSRGVPTNKFGHLHISHFDPNEQNIQLQKDISATERLNHYGPWNILVHEKFNEPFARVINSVASNHFQSDDGVNVSSIAEFVKNPNGTTSSNYGYELSFSDPKSFKEIYGVLISIGGHFEDFYKKLGYLHEEYYKNQSDSEKTTELENDIIFQSKLQGFTDEEAKRLASFVFAIKPTYGQLAQWEQELLTKSIGDSDPDLQRIRKEKQRYERLLQKIGDDPSKDTLSIALIRDTITPPDQYKTIERTWPVHASAAFIIDDFEMTDEGSKINSLKIFPGIAASEACVERVLGTVVKRSLAG